MSTFGGIWKDFAVEQPGRDCFDSDGSILVRSTVRDRVRAWSRIPDGDKSAYQWLDRRVPKSLTAEQAFDIMSVMYPGIASISRIDTGRDFIVVSPDMDPVPIEWSGAKCYSPPLEGKWVAVTVVNWTSYLHHRCKCGANQNIDGHLVGVSPRGEMIVQTQGGGFLTSNVVRVQVPEEK